MGELCHQKLVLLPPLISPPFSSVNTQISQEAVSVFKINCRQVLPVS